MSPPLRSEESELQQTDLSGQWCKSDLTSGIQSACPASILHSLWQHWGGLQMNVSGIVRPALGELRLDLGKEHLMEFERITKSDKDLLE